MANLKLTLDQGRQKSDRTYALVYIINGMNILCIFKDKTLKILFYFR